VRGSHYGDPGSPGCCRGVTQRDDPLVRASRCRAAPVAAALLVAALALGACGGAGSSAEPTTPKAPSPPTAQPGANTLVKTSIPATPTTRPTSTTQPPAAPPTSAPAVTTTTGPGSLPQTDVLPSSATAQFREEMEELWEGVQEDSPDAAAGAFFPEAAYVQLKAIPYPAADFVGRLFADYRLDLAAAHALLGPGAAAARLLHVSVPSDEAEWIPPGYCYNTIGYWHEPGARLVYEEGGQVRSFGIASLISWRGVWYVVHLGAVLRSSDVGVVDAPAVGPGVAGPAGGC